MVFLLGYVENDEKDKWEAPGIINKKKAKEMIARFSTVKQVEQAFTELKDYWNESVVQIFRKKPRCKAGPYG